MKFWKVLSVFCFVVAALCLIICGLVKITAFAVPGLILIGVGFGCRKTAKDKAAFQAERDQAALYKAQHPKIYTKVAGVTFDNEDGTSRQKILRKAQREKVEGTVSLRLGEFEGRPAIYVLYDGQCIGQIPKGDIDAVTAALEKIEYIDLTVKSFTPKGREEEKPERVYYGELEIQYEA